MGWISRAITVGLLTCAAQVAAAKDIVVIVDHKPETVEVFVTLGSEFLPRAFGAVPPGLTNSDGLVEIDSFRDGTADIGDWMASHWTARFGEQTVPLEAMALMVHPKDDALPFATPLDGYIAMSVCNAPVGAAPVPLEGTQVYGGFIAYPDNPKAPLELQLGGAEMAGLTVEVRSFDAWEPRNVAQFTLDETGIVKVPATERFSAVAQSGPAALLAAVSVLALFGVGRALSQHRAGS